MALRSTLEEPSVRPGLAIRRRLQMRPGCLGAGSVVVQSVPETAAVSGAPDGKMWSWVWNDHALLFHGAPYRSIRRTSAQRIATNVPRTAQNVVRIIKHSSRPFNRGMF